MNPRCQTALLHPCARATDTLSERFWSRLCVDNRRSSSRHQSPNGSRGIRCIRTGLYRASSRVGRRRSGLLRMMMRCRFSMPIRPENAHRYGADWAEFSRYIRFDRAGGRCECEGECGRGTHTGRCPNEHGKPAYGTGSTVVLTTAHLTHEPECRDEDKVKAMCNGCHLHYDREHHAQTAYRTRRQGKAAGDLFDTEPS